MNKKNILRGVIFSIIVILPLILSSGKGADALVDSQYFGNSPNILVTMIKQEPDPVEPGNQFEASFKIDNNGTTANNLIVEILPSYPVSLLPDQSTSRNIGSLGASQRTERSVILKFKLRVAQDATDGSREIKMRYKTDDSESWVTLDNFRINVQTHEAILAVEKSSTSPAVTAPGERARLRLELKNYASSILKDIRISLGIDATGDANPFSPLGSTNEKVISYIEPQSVMALDFELLVDADAASKAYKIPLKVKYFDNLNKNYSLVNVITVIVGDKPDIGASLERTEIYSPDSAGNVVFRFVNKGHPNIKFLSVKVLQNDNVKVVGADEAYIGKLDSDDFSTAEFKLYLTGKDVVKIPLHVSYKDANNNDYKEDVEVPLRLYSGEDAKRFGLAKSQYGLWITAFVIVLVAGILLYRSIRKKRKK